MLKFITLEGPSMFQHRLKVLLTIIGAGFLILVLRLFHLQVISHNYYRQKAARNIAFTEQLPTIRGVIRDRNNVVLATDSIDYEARVFLWRLERLSEKDRDKWFRLVAWSLELTVGEVHAAVERAERFAISVASHRKTEKQRSADLRYIRRHRPGPMFRNISKAQVLRLELNEFRLPLYRRRGRSYPILKVCDSTRRVYPRRSCAGNLLGYMSRINSTEYDKKPDGKGYCNIYDGSKLKAYRIDELIGRTGLERYHNRRLRGSRGRRMGVKDVRGRVQREIEVLPPRVGGTVRLTIDIRLQRLLESAMEARLAELKRDGMGHNGGAAVIMDPNNGDVLACVTSPRFDPNTVRENFAQLRKDKTAPLFDRSRMGLYPLGSIFKVVVALAGLESDTLSGSTEFTCTSSFSLGRKTWRCLSSHGPLRLGQALERSCNCYFYQAGLAVGGERIHQMALRTGLGMPTGLDLADVAGYVPFPTSQSEVINLAIGGGQLQVTPLQTARMMCVFANGGKLPRPRLNRARPVQMTDLGLDPLKVRTVRWGMHDVVMGSSGTARRSGHVPGLTYAGKTGTANLATPGLYHAWYCGFAPFKNPKLAFAAVIERTQEYGGLAAAPLIRNVLITMLQDPGLAEYLTDKTRTAEVDDDD